MKKTRNTNLSNYLTLPIFKVVSEVIGDSDIEVFVIGGFVRDLLLNRPSKDIDIVVVGSGIELAKKVAAYIGSNTNVAVFKNFGTAMLKHNDLEVEFVGARKESYQRNTRKPIVENGTLEDDLKRRDFTINSLAISLHKNSYGDLTDTFNGISDLNNKILRTPLEPEQTFSDDPLRMLRAIRFATQLGFTIEPHTYQSLTDSRERISIISKERIIDELHKIVMSPKPSIGFILLENTGLLQLIFPQLNNLKGIEVKDDKKHKDVFLHSIKVLDNISPNTDNLWLRWAALLHDIGKPQTKKFTDKGWTFHGHDFIGAKMIPSIFKSLKLPLNEKMKYVKKLVALHLRPIILAEDCVTDSAVRRLLFDASDDIDDLMTLCEADITSGIREKVERFLQNFKLVRQKLKEIEEKDAIRNWQPPVSGEIIIETFDIRPCKTVGIIKNAIKEAILDGKIGNNYDEAFSFMLKLGKELGLDKK